MFIDLCKELEDSMGMEMLEDLAETKNITSLRYVESQHVVFIKQGNEHNTAHVEW
jgi:hypothetical protein